MKSPVDPSSLSLKSQAIGYLAVSQWKMEPKANGGLHPPRTDALAKNTYKLDNLVINIDLRLGT